MSYIERDVTLNIDGKTAKFDDMVYIFKGDRDIQLNIKIIDTKMKFSRTNISGNVLTPLPKGCYARVGLVKPKGGDPVIRDRVAIEDDKVKFLIDSTVCDELDEVGIHKIQIQIYALDDDASPRWTLPSAAELEVCKPDVDFDGITPIVGLAKAGLSMTISEGDTTIVDFNEDGTYNKTTWSSGDVISTEKLNKIENVLDHNVNKTREHDTQIKEIEIEKLDKNGIVTMANMGQDVKEAMTGGSVAVVGKDTVLEENIVNKQITPIKTNFLKLDTSKNLFDGNYKNVGQSGSSKPYKYVEGGDRLSAVVKVKPNTMYSIIKVGVENFLRVSTNTQTELVNNSYFDGSIGWDGGSVRNYTFTTGSEDNLLIVTVSTTNVKPSFLQIVEGTTSVVTTNEYASYIPNNLLGIYSKKEVNDLLSEVVPFSNRKIKAIKTGNKLDIYVPSKKNQNYIHYRYELDNRPSINLYQYRVTLTEIVDNELNTLYHMISDTEWEGVVKEEGASDFLGGFHGDETNEWITLHIDGIEYDIKGVDFNMEVSKSIKIVNKSIINSCNNTILKLFDRWKISEWTLDEYTIINDWRALENVTLTHGYFTLFSMPRTTNNSEEFVTYGRYDDKYITQNVNSDATQGSCLYPSALARTGEFWGSKMYAKCKCESDLYGKYSSLMIADRGQNNIFKFYYNLVNKATINKGEILKAKSIYELVF